jgi:hypothetical protein
MGWGVVEVLGGVADGGVEWGVADGVVMERCVVKEMG